MRTFRALAADPATSPEVIDVLADSLAEADALAAELTALDEVDRALTLSSFVPEDQEQKLALIDDLAFYLGPILEPGRRPEPLTADRAPARARAAERERRPRGGGGRQSRRDPPRRGPRPLHRDGPERGRARRARAAA